MDPDDYADAADQLRKEGRERSEWIEVRAEVVIHAIDDRSADLALQAMRAATNAGTTLHVIETSRRLVP